RAFHLLRYDLPTIVINDTDLCAFHRQVQSGIVLHGCFLPSGFDNQKCAPQPRSEGSSRNYTMTRRSQPEDDRGSEGDGREEGRGVAIVAGGDAPPILEAAEHDLDAAA